MTSELTDRPPLLTATVEPVMSTRRLRASDSTASRRSDDPFARSHRVIRGVIGQR